MLADPEDEGDYEGPEEDIVGEVGAREAYMGSRGGKNRDNWLPMGSDRPTGLQPAKNIKDYDGGPIVVEEGMVTSILEAFDLIYLTTLIKLHNEEDK